MHVVGQIDRVAFRDLERGAEAIDEIEADHGGGHSALGAETRAPSAAGEVFGDRGMPGGGLEALFHFVVRDFPERLHRGFALGVGLLAGAIERGRAGVDEVKDAIADERVADLFAAGGFDRLKAPISAEVGENLRAVGEQPAEEHARAVERVVFGGDDVGRAFAVPIEGRVEDRLHEVAVREVVGPLALALETGGDRVVALRLFAESHFREHRISDHQIAGDQRHLHAVLPLAIELLAGAGGFRGVVIFAFRAVRLHPGEGLFIFGLVVLALAHAAGDFGHVDGLHPHAEPFFP
jgi:hypothetical protein